MSENVETGSSGGGAPLLDPVPSLSVVMDAEPTFVRWDESVAVALPELSAAVSDFTAGDRPAAISVTRWLQECALPEARQTVTRLVVADGHVLGFYSMCSGQVQLKSKHRGELGVEHPTQGASIVTKIGRDPRYRFDGGRLVQHAIYKATQVQAMQGNPVLALDPHDAETEAMWIRKFQFRRSQTPVPGVEGVKRLWLALLDPI